MTIRVTWGSETFYPVRYNGYEVGSLSADLAVDPASTPGELADLVLEVYEQLAAIGDRMAAMKRDQFGRHLPRSKLDK